MVEDIKHLTGTDWKISLVLKDSPSGEKKTKPRRALDYSSFTKQQHSQKQSCLQDSSMKLWGSNDNDICNSMLAMTWPNMDNNIIGISCIRMDHLLCIAFELSRALVIHLTKQKKNDDMLWLGDIKYSRKSMRQFKPIFHFSILAIQMLYEMNTSSVGLYLSLPGPHIVFHKGKCAVTCSKSP